MSAGLIPQLQARGRMLARAATARLRARVARRWQALGLLTADEGKVRLRGPGLLQRRRGTRLRLADPDLLWPGDE